MNRLLIVDDESDARVGLRRFAHRESLIIDEAGSVDDALAHIERFGPPTIALCDVRMPVKDGFGLAEQLRAQWPETAVVMVTAVEDFRLAVRCLRMGVTDWVAKPFSRAHVRQAIDRALSTRAMYDSRLTLGHAFTLSVDLAINLWATVDAILALVSEHDADGAARIRRRAGLAVNLALMLGLDETDVADCELAAILHELPDVTRALAQARNAVTAPVLQISNRRHAELLLKFGGSSARAEGDLAMLQQVADVTRAVAQGGDSGRQVRSLGEAVMQVPALAGAARLLVAIGRDPRALRDDPEPHVPLGARIVQVVCRYDHSVTRKGAPSALDAAELLTRSSAADDRVVVDALQTLVTQPRASEAIFVGWLSEARQRLAEARRGGHRPAIRAAQAAYDELRCSL